MCRHTIELILPDHKHRQRAEDFIKARYQTCYGATVRHFPRRLLVSWSADKSIKACCGLRDDREGFISSQYLRQDSASSLTTSQIDAIDTSTCLEFTTLAARDRNSLFAIIAAACDFGRKEGKSAALFTTTHLICRLLARQGVQLHKICDATEANAPSPGPWGTYYSGGAAVYFVPDTIQAGGMFSTGAQGLVRAHAA